jgi:raffinose/stachyose/melibiose transport system substrate-binding protein
MLKLRVLIAMLVTVLALGLAACGGDDDDDESGSDSGSSGQTAKPKPGTLELWVGGNFAGATPGTPYRKWLDSQIDRFKAENKGSDVKITLLSTDNEQVAAKLQAAFQAKKAPDMMLFYSGGYTTPYENQLLELNPYFDKTPGFFDSLSGMDLSCEDLDCKGGENTIIAVPQDFGTYGLFYNKAMFKKAGVEAPIEDWDGLLSACAALKKTGVTPITFGDRDGYSTDNWVTLMYGSYFEDGDVAKVNDGELKYSDPKLVKPLEQISQLREQGCLNKDASTRENFDANSDFTSGKSAMVLMYPAVIPDFKKKLGKDLGIMPIPQASDGPLAGRSVGNAFYNYVITKQSDNPGLAWEFIKVASDKTAAGELLTILGTPPALKGVDESLVKDEFVQFFVDASQDPAMPVLDSVIPVPVALTFYKELQQSTSGKKTPQEAMESMDEQLPTLE